VGWGREGEGVILAVIGATSGQGTRVAWTLRPPGPVLWTAGPWHVERPPPCAVWCMCGAGVLQGLVLFASPSMEPSDFRYSEALLSGTAPASVNGVPAAPSASTGRGTVQVVRLYGKAVVFGGYTGACL
jgi:hypothetical protein